MSEKSGYGIRGRAIEDLTYQELLAACIRLINQLREMHKSNLEGYARRRNGI